MLGHLHVLRGGVLAPLGHRAFRGLQFVLGRLPDLRVVAVREEHLPVAALVGEAVHRDEDRAAADHHALATAGLLETDRQVELLEQRADRVGHVLDDLAAGQDPGRRGRHPFHLDRLRRQVRDRPRLQQVEPAAGDRPLDVLGHAVEPRLDGTAQLDEFPEGLRRQRRTAALGLVDRFEPRALVAFLDDLLFLGADDRLRRLAGRAVDHVGVGRHLAADDGLAETEAGVDDRLGAFAGRRVRGEQDARDLGRHHDLHDDRHCHLALVDAHLVAVGDRTRRPERCPAVAHRRDHGFLAADVEVGVLLARERRVRQILGVCRRAHGHRRSGRLESAVGGGDLGDGEVGRGVFRQEFLDRGRRLVEGDGAVHEFRLRQRHDALLQAVLRHEGAVGGRRDVEAARHREARVRGARQRAALAAQQVEVVGAGVERADEGGCCFGRRHRFRRPALRAGCRRGRRRTQWFVAHVASSRSGRAASRTGSG